MMNGVLVIRKEKGYTSHDVVAKLRGILHTKKIGHTGTLDPDAEGVLPVVIGKATKLVELLTEKEKMYRTVLHLGIETDTQDISGEILCIKEVSAGEEEVCQTVQSFLGEQMQIPPMYSALKVNGRKLYELAREGKTIERDPRPVTFYALDILKMELPLVEINVRCSKGTYIRTLCHDIGKKLGCGGCMESLVRTGSGKFTLDQAITLDEVQQYSMKGQLEKKIITIEEILSEYPAVVSTPAGDRFLENGNPLKYRLTERPAENGQVRMYTSQGQFIGIYLCDSEKKCCFPVKMLF